MAGSSFGTIFTITTWGESHGKAIGVVIDGCPAGVLLQEEDIQKFLDRRKPGQSKYTTGRAETDQVEILSGVFQGVTTGTPISLMVRNQDQHSKDYSNIAETYRPGHADYTFQEKYGIRDYRGGGRSSGRETIGRVAAGAVASQVLSQMGIKLLAYSKAIGPVEAQCIDLAHVNDNPLFMPDQAASDRARKFLDECIGNQDSAGGMVECMVWGMPVGIGQPVFDKLDANLAKAMLSIGAVKGFEMGDGFAAASSRGSDNNDNFRMKDGQVCKITNHSGGVLGGISDGSELVLRVAIKPTPSISQPQSTVNQQNENTTIEIHGRHDPIIVPRAVVVVESMAAITILDGLLVNMASRIDKITEFYHQSK